MFGLHHRRYSLTCPGIVCALIWGANKPRSTGQLSLRSDTGLKYGVEEGPRGAPLTRIERANFKAWMNGDPAPRFGRIWRNQGGAGLLMSSLQTKANPGATAGQFQMRRCDLRLLWLSRTGKGQQRQR